MDDTILLTEVDVQTRLELKDSDKSFILDKYKRKEEVGLLEGCSGWYCHKIKT